MPNQGQSSKKPFTENGLRQGLGSAVHQRRIRTVCKISMPGMAVAILGLLKVQKGAVQCEGVKATTN
jgi:hypothetical protein